MPNSNMSNGKGQHRRIKNKQQTVAREVLEQIDDTNPTIQMFKAYAAELDEKHDRHETVVKLSRDITIESKRIIFLLHNSDTDIEEKKQKVLDEAEKRLNALVDKNFKSVALELDGHDQYMHLRAYTSGLQEFVEALLFHRYLTSNTICDWRSINDKLQYEIEDKERNGKRVVQLLFPQVEYFLGMEDFTGELMRKCINCLGSGNFDICFKLCDFVKDIYSGFLGVHIKGYKEINRKQNVLRQSLMKMEMVCYNIKIRGSEVPKHMLANVLEQPEQREDDEGFF